MPQYTANLGNVCSFGMTTTKILKDTYLRPATQSKPPFSGFTHGYNGKY